MSAAVPASSPLISVLVVNFNSSALLRKCLDSLGQSTIVDDVQIIVVDNASCDFDLHDFRNTYPGVTFVPETTNTTFTAANNAANSLASGALVLMLNPDTRVEPETLERAARHLIESPDLAAVGAYLIGSDGALQRYYRRLPSFSDVAVLLFEPLFRATRRGRRFLMLDETFEGRTFVSHVAAAFLLIRGEFVETQLLDPNYFNFLSDLDLSRRLSRVGRVAVFDDVRCHHLGGGGGVGTRDPILRLRLYHDFAWGIRRYFGSRLTPTHRVILQVALLVYWITRAGRLALTHPRVLPRAVATVVAAMSGSPPRY